MADWVWAHIAPYATLPVFAGFFVVSLLFILVLFPLTKRHFKGIVTLDGNPWGFSVADAAELLGTREAAGKMTPDQLKRYRQQEMLTDMLFPLVYGFGFAIAMVMLARYNGAPRWLIFLPLAAALADYIENISVTAMIGRRLRGEDLGPMAGIGSVASRFKHFLLLATVLVLLGLCGFALWRRYF
jgi:hypothetical protein